MDSTGGISIEGFGVFVVENTGVMRASGSIISNNSTIQNYGLITSTGVNYTAVTLNVSASLLDNHGTIDASGTTGWGVEVSSGIVSNASGALISGAYYGVRVSPGGSLTNLGSITASTRAGVQFWEGGSVSNGIGGQISGPTGVGSTNVAGVNQLGTLVNFGTIRGSSSAGVDVVTKVDVTNNVGGVVAGNLFGIRLEAASGSVDNSGTISASGASGTGVNLLAGGVVTNRSAGSITGAAVGVLGSGASAVMDNSGTISATGTGGIAINLLAGGVLTNNVGGVIAGAVEGARVFGASGTVDNSGTIGATGTNGLAAILLAGGVFTNRAGGLITGVVEGAHITGASGTVDNSGTISASNASSGWAVILHSGGNVTNAPDGVITGGNVGVYLSLNGTVTNSGSITGTSGAGINMQAGGSISNAAGASLTGRSGISIKNATGYVTNDGAITGGTSSGVYLSRGGTVSNSASGAIAGYRGVRILGAAGTVTNAGHILSTTKGGVVLTAGGSETNAAGGTISGASSGMYIAGGSGTIANFGSVIAHGNAALYLVAGGTVTNGVGAVASGTTSGARLKAGGGLLNDGSITGTTGFGIVLDAGGLVVNGASGSIAGFTDGIYAAGGGTITNLGTIVGTGATPSAVRFAGGTTNELDLATGSLLIGHVDGGNAIGAGHSSTLRLEAGNGTLSGLGSDIVNFNTIEFATGAVWTIAGGINAFSGAVINDFSVGSTIDLVGAAEASLGFIGNVITLVGDAGILVTFTGLADGTFLRAVPDGTGGTALSIDAAAPCFATGTRIRTARGEVPVEVLRVGDVVATGIGGDWAPVKWIGHRTVNCAVHPRPQDVMPVRIVRGAFAPDVPNRDLVLSPDHSVYVDGVLVPARYLVNGATVLQEPVAGVTYWHVELERHDVILAEGMACESYLDTGNRAAFANGGDVVMKDADFARGVWSVAACAPVVLDGARLRAVRARLVARAVALGHVLTRDPDLHLLVDGAVVEPDWIGAEYGFVLPEGARTVRFMSRSFVPADADVDSDDRRNLGVAVTSLILDGQAIALDDPRLSTGWEAAEDGWRWTRGDGALALEGGCVLEARVARFGRYWGADKAVGATAGMAGIQPFRRSAVN